MSIRRRDDIAEQLQSGDIVFNVLEHVRTGDRIEALAGKCRAIAFLHVTHPQLESWVTAKRVQRARGTRWVGFDADHVCADVEETSGHRSDAGPDFQHAGADVRSKQSEDVSVIPMRLAHRLKIVRGKLMLGLGEPTIDHWLL